MPMMPRKEGLKINLSERILFLMNEEERELPKISFLFAINVVNLPMFTRIA
jgi:hypothetical protein